MKHVRELRRRGGVLFFVSHLPAKGLRIKDERLRREVEQGAEEGSLEVRAISTKGHLWHGMLFWTALGEIPVEVTPNP